MSTAFSIGIIGGADGPTAIFVTGRFPVEIILLAAGLVILIFWLSRKK